MRRVATSAKRGPRRNVCDDRLDAFRRAAKPRLDRTVVAISHPSCDAKSIGRTANKLAIADALDATIDGDVDFGDRRLHGSILRRLSPNRLGQRIFVALNRNGKVANINCLQEIHYAAGRESVADGIFPSVERAELKSCEYQLFTRRSHDGAGRETVASDIFRES
jgi:hypothetical protein